MSGDFSVGVDHYWLQGLLYTGAVPYLWILTQGTVRGAQDAVYSKFTDG